MLMKLWWCEKSTDLPAVSNSYNYHCSDELSILFRYK